MKPIDKLISEEEWEEKPYWERTLQNRLNNMEITINQLISSHNKLIKIIDKLKEGNNDMP
ncbi:hypothetical protein LCGC14_1921680 [marine sediment metagenome]|uniref:Uncharacterized protein n=1 Tax=marine sediment metagenome TaxID=412755 RepID=A0A0F9INA6_9ZZZZ|nr:hypothetical protein [Candidatus Scalindua sp.]